MKRVFVNHELINFEVQPRVKRLREGCHFDIRVLLPRQAAGCIIGKKGANIQRLRIESNSEIWLPDSGCSERILTISSDDHETATKVLKRILLFIKPDSTPDRSNILELRLLIHQSLAGSIIGRSGHKIKELNEAFGASIKVFKHCPPQSTDRCVSVKGSIDSIGKAVSEIYKTISKLCIRGPEEPYNPCNFSPHQAKDYGGYASYEDLASLNLLRDYCASVYHGNGQLSFLHNNNFVPFQHTNFSVPPPHYFPQVDNNSIPMSIQVTVRKDEAGAIIGPRGSRIRNIRNETKASIVIEEPKDGVAERIVTISGTQAQIEMAQYLLQESVRCYGLGPKKAVK